VCFVVEKNVHVSKTPNTILPVLKIFNIFNAGLYNAISPKRDVFKKRNCSVTEETAVADPAQYDGHQQLHAPARRAVHPAQNK
jgi:hypothetical protein